MLWIFQQRLVWTRGYRHISDPAVFHFLSRVGLRSLFNAALKRCRRHSGLSLTEDFPRYSLMPPTGGTQQRMKCADVAGWRTKKWRPANGASCILLYMTRCALSTLSEGCAADTKLPRGLLVSKLPLLNLQAGPKAVFTWFSSRVRTFGPSCCSRVNVFCVAVIWTRKHCT